jgi:hypothetical protein
VRAAGVKVEKVKEIINKLLAEPMPEGITPAPAPAVPAAPAGEAGEPKKDDSK